MENVRDIYLNHYSSDFGYGDNVCFNYSVDNEKGR